MKLSSISGTCLSLLRLAGTHTPPAAYRCHTHDCVGQWEGTRRPMRTCVCPRRCTASLRGLCSCARTVPDTFPQAAPSPPSISSVRADSGPSFSSPPPPAWPAAPPPPPVWCSMALATKGGTKPPRPDTPAAAPPPPAPPRGRVKPWRGACRCSRQVDGGRWHDGLQAAHIEVGLTV